MKYVLLLPSFCLYFAFFVIYFFNCLFKDKETETKTLAQHHTQLNKAPVSTKDKVHNTVHMAWTAYLLKPPLLNINFSV